MEHTLELLEKAINIACWDRAMAKCQRRKSIKTWDRLGRKMEEYKEKEREKIFDFIVNLGKEI